jgi:triphosphoribosyl-dephospho-CoA synthase
MTIGEQAELACRWEATARKPGNVHPQADFADLTYDDFVRSARAIVEPLQAAPHVGVGPTVLAAIRATRAVVNTNTNLGLVLLLAPLAAVPTGVEVRAGVAAVLRQTTVADTQAVFAAIRLAQPGGLGRAAAQDVADVPTLPLRAVMALAAERDDVARQYATDFADVFTTGLPALRTALAHGLEAAIIHTALALHAARPDTLIARKCGPLIAAVAQQQAQAVLAGTLPLADFDAWLRADGHQRNPGTTADLVGATLLVALRQGELAPDSACLRS